MWTFAGLLVVAGVLWAGFRRVGRYLGMIGFTLGVVANRAAEKAGDPPVITESDVARRID